MSAAATPLMQQYREIKARHQDAILFFRMGDFYEMFFDDALSASKALSLTLTARGGHCGYMDSLRGPSWIDRTIVQDLLRD